MDNPGRCHQKDLGSNFERESDGETTGLGVHTACDPTTVVYGDEYGALPTPTRTGYSFAGWMYNGEIVTSTTTMTTGNHTLVAQWTGNPYTVTFDSQGGTDCQSITVTFGSTYGQLPTPTKENSQLEGWYLGDIKIEPSTVVSTAENHTLVARWTEITDWITVTFVDDSTTLETRQYGTNENGDIAYGTLPSPTKEGYVFTSWHTDSSLSDESTVTTATPAGKADHTLYAKWQVITYTVTFNANGYGTAPESQTIAHGDTASHPETLASASHNHDGNWYTDSSCTTIFDFDTPIPLLNSAAECDPHSQGTGGRDQHVSLLATELTFSLIC